MDSLAPGRAHHGHIPTLLFQFPDNFHLDIAPPLDNLHPPQTWKLPFRKLTTKNCATVKSGNSLGWGYPGKKIFGWESSQGKLSDYIYFSFYQKTRFCHHQKSPNTYLAQHTVSSMSIVSKMSGALIMVNSVFDSIQLVTGIYLLSATVLYEKKF